MSILNEDFLLDSFHITGNDLDEFASALKEMREHTDFMRVKSNDLSVLSYDKDESNDKYMSFYIFNPDNLFTEVKNKADRIVVSSSIASFKNGILGKGNFENLIKEIEEDTQTMLQYKNHYNYCTSANILSTMDRFGLNGTFLQEKDKVTGYFERNLLIAKRFKKGYGCTLCIKNYNKIAKVFSILSEKYHNVDQKFIFDIIEKLSDNDSLGKPECYRWEISHFMTSVYIDFPEKASELQTQYHLPNNFIPGIRIMTSDTGDCSIIIEGTWRLGSSIVATHNQVKKKHSGKIDIENIYEEVENSIFAEYTKLPIALCDLMSQDITKANYDLSKARGRSQNRQCLENTLVSAFKQLNFVKVIGKKNEKAIREQLLEELDLGMSYTAYDIAVAVMELPARITENTDEIPSYIDAFRKACGNAPYIDYFKKENKIISLTA